MGRTPAWYSNGGSEKSVGSAPILDCKLFSNSSIGFPAAALIRWRGARLRLMVDTGSSCDHLLSRGEESPEVSRMGSEGW